MRRHVGRALAALMMSVVAATAADAAPITINFTGVVSGVSAGLAGTFAPGDLLSGSYTFESTTAPRAGATVNGAVYDAVTLVSFVIGGYGAADVGPLAGPEIQVENDPLNPAFFDRYALVARAIDGLSGPAVNGNALSAFGFRLDDNTNTAFATALLLPTSLDLADFTSNGFFVFFGGELLDGTLTSVSSVPEPFTLGLTGLGLAALARRRFRRSSM